MNINRSIGQNPKNGVWSIVAAIMVYLFIAVMLTWWTVQRVDRQLRDELLLQARLASHVVDMELVKSFSGADTDLENRDYLRLKLQFAELQQVNAKCRFVYLLGMKPTGEVFFYLDNEPVGAEHFSPPGQIYDDASEEMMAAFVNGLPFVEGPLGDAWGIWISALVPLVDPQTGKPAALLGMDIDARDWSRDVAARAALPVSLTLVTLVFVAMGLVLIRSRATLGKSRDRARKQRTAIADLALHPAVISGDMEKAFASITEVSAQVMAVDHVSIWLLGEDGRHLRCFSLCEGGAIKECPDDTTEIGGYLTTLLSQRRSYAEDAQTDALHIRGAGSLPLASQGTIACLDAGILVKGEVSGVISFKDSNPERQWHPDEEAFANTVAAMAAQVISYSERVQLVKALQVSEEQFRDLFESAPVGIFQTTPAGRYLSVNPEYARLAGYREPAEMIAQVTDIANQIYARPEDRTRYIEQLQRYGRVKNYEVEWKRRDGSNFWVSMNTTVRRDAEHGVVYTGFLIDITERRLAEAEREALQLQLTQAKKLESIGRLAGGVAHDFNNMLAVILGYSEMALQRLDPAEPIFANLRQIQRAAQRSADLTRQLLAFARKQTVTPQVLDLGKTVEGMLDMLRRLIGENLDLVWLPGEGPLLVKMDPSQIDQLVINLSINARDAIADTGKVSIETDAVALTEGFCAAHPDFTPGEYVLLTVSDTGCGMDQATLANLFEPFFTTKELGKGTGMGLATVYGIVKQNGGVINVSSEPGKGSIFKIYLPRFVNETDLISEPAALSDPPAGTETILVVEDEPMMLEMVTGILKTQGYAVLPANTPAEALHLARAAAGKIALLVTDVVMPGMNGRDLAIQLLAILPRLRCLFMSGYTANVIAQRGVLEDGADFIQKPFTAKQFATKVRALLDRDTGPVFHR